MKNKRITFIQTPVPELKDDLLEPNLGLLYLATYMKTLGIEVKYIDLSGISSNHWRYYIPTSDIYCFSTFTPSYHRTLKIKDYCRIINPNCITIAGGPHASALPTAVSDDFDFVVVGEGEVALKSIIEDIPSRMTANIIYGDPIMNLDSLPFPDYSLVKLDEYTRLVGGKKSISILTSRGCPYRCAFCNSIIIGRDKKPRFRSSNNVCKEIINLYETFEINSFRFQDDIFNLHLPRIRKMGNILRDYEFIFRCFARIDLMSENMVQSLVNMGVRHVSFGIESGSQRILNAMDKQQSIEEMVKGFENVKAQELMTRVYLIVGFPGETWETVEETIELMKTFQPDEFIVYPLIPYPGTPIFRDPEKYGITFIDPDFTKYFQVFGDKQTGFILETKKLDREKIHQMRDYMIKELLKFSTWAGDSRQFK